MLTTFTELYAVPGEGHIIDGINPETGLTFICGETEEQIKARYPNAVRFAWDAWQATKAERQNTPVRWEPITAERYDDLLGCLPPIGWNSLGFLVGEPSDHCVLTGHARYQACIAKHGEHFASSRPLTVKEWKEIR